MPANTHQREATAHQSIGGARSKAYLIPECRSSEDRARWRALASMKRESAVERSSLELGMTKMESGRLAGKRKRAVSIFIPKALRRILVCSGYSRFGPPSNKNLFQKWLAAALVTSIPSGAQPLRTGRGRCFGLVPRECKDGQRNSQKGRKKQPRDTYIRWGEACPRLYRSFA